MADGMIAPRAQRVVDFVKLIPEGRPPKRADKSAAGYLPGRAMRYCEAITSATGYGYWVFPVVDLQLLWDGEQIFWSYDNAACWLPLTGTASGAVQFPGFAAQFDESAPPELRGFSPPFLTSLTEPGSIQIWTGLVARTRPGWSLLLRQPANLPPTPGLSGWEGVVETDHWFGPLFSIFRITRTDFPVRLRAHVPFLQIQPVPQLAYRDDTVNDFSCRSTEEMTGADWADLGNVLLPNPQTDTHLGAYAVQVRKRRSCPHHNTMLNSTLDTSNDMAIAGVQHEAPVG